MAKIRLTKNELKRQKDNLKRFTRYLPTLELKKKQLLLEIRNIQRQIDELEREHQQAENEIAGWVAVFSDEADLETWIQVKDLRLGHGNIAGIDIPVFEELEFETVDYDLLNTPLWVDAALAVCRDQIINRVKQTIAVRQQTIIREELRTTIQRIKMFEEVKIPEARDNIRIIRIFLGDLQTAEVVRGKIAKNKIEKKKSQALHDR